MIRNKIIVPLCLFFAMSQAIRLRSEANTFEEDAVEITDNEYLRLNQLNLA